jgi:hypothetical protein
MDYVELNKIMKDLLDEAPCNWGVVSQDLTEHDFCILKTWARHRLTLINRLVTYAELRGGNGCGDSGHDLALEATR